MGNWDGTERNGRQWAHAILSNPMNRLAHASLVFCASLSLFTVVLTESRVSAEQPYGWPTNAAFRSHTQTQRQYLSGHGKDDAVPWRFFCTAGPQSGYWTNLPVPSNWELHGFGVPYYQYESNSAFAEQGRYQLGFQVPSDWLGRRVFLVFDGVMTDARVELNGQSAGPVHQGAFYQFRYDVTSLLKYEGSNFLDVLVHKRSANDSINRAERAGDYWLFGGIFRPVYLEAVPPQFIERVAIDARADGTFAMDVFTCSGEESNTLAAVEAQIETLEGQPVGPAFRAGLEGAKTSLRTNVPGPTTWTAETPRLYRVAVRLLSGDRVWHHATQRFGFRTIEVRNGDGIYVNGRRVVLQGVDRHSFWPDSGRCLSEAVHRLDIALMKEMNMNAVRMSHYPPDEQFLDLCDELGLYVLDELAGWHQHYDTPTGTRLVEEMLKRDINHPCILFWDNGNENGWNTAVDGEFARWDPQQRRVLHPWTTFSGVNTAHYLAYPRAAEAAQGAHTYRRADNSDFDSRTNTAKSIYMPTEFLHALYDGGAGAGMEDYWKMMRESSCLGGGFVWALLDEGVKRPESGKIDVVRNKAPDGIVGPYREKEASFYTIKELWSPIVVTRKRETDGQITLSIANRYSFTDASQCAFTWQLRKFRGPAEAEAGFTVGAEGKLPSPAIPPGGEAEVALSLPAGASQFDAVALKVEDPGGRELWTWVWPLPGLDTRRLLAASLPAKVTVADGPEVVRLQVGDLNVRINRQTGLLESLRRGSETCSLTNGPRPAVGSARLVGLDTSTSGGDGVVSAKFEGNLKSVTWRLRPNGWLQCAYTYTATGPQNFHGVLFDYPEKLVTGKKWLGDGPYRVWKNRLRGATLNVWENAYNNTITGWRDWIYPEFKGCFANVRWLQLQTTEGSLLAVVETGPAFVQVLTPEFPPANLQAKTVVELPQAGLAFLNAIPPIGTKFHTPAETGPQGQRNEAQGDYSGTVDFLFGAETNVR